MAIPSDIEVLRTIEYRAAVGYQLQQMPGLLKPFAGSNGSYSDKKVQIEDRFDTLVATEKIARNADTPNVDISAERRWLTKPRTQQIAPLLDRDDLISTKIEVKSPVAVQTTRAIRQAQDDRFLQGYFGNALTGEDGATVVPFKAANVVAANQDEGGNIGLSLNKLIYMQMLMKQRFVDIQAEKPIAIITAKQKRDLLKLIQVQSRDYNPAAQEPLQTGVVTEFMGFRFVEAEIGNAASYPLGSALTTQGGTGYRLVPFFVPSGLHWGSWTDFFGKIEDLPGKSYSTQIYAETCGAATRVNEDKCFQMVCNEA